MSRLPPAYLRASPVLGILQSQELVPTAPLNPAVFFLTLSTAPPLCLGPKFGVTSTGASNTACSGATILPSCPPNRTCECSMCGATLQGHACRLRMRIRCQHAIFTSMHMHIHLYIFIHICTYMLRYIYIHTCMFVFMYICVLRLFCSVNRKLRPLPPLCRAH